MDEELLDGDFTIDPDDLPEALRETVAAWNTALIGNRPAATRTAEWKTAPKKAEPDRPA